MTQINSVGASSDIGIQAYRGAEGLTGEAMMTYISTRLNDIDGDVNAMMKEQQNNITKKEVLQKWRSTLEKCKADPNGHATYGAEFLEYRDSLPLGSVERKAAEAALASFDGRLPTNTDAAWNQQIASIDMLIEGVSSQTELTMIRMQQLMSQRQTAVQLTTNMLSKFNQGDEAIVANIR